MFSRGTYWSADRRSAKITGLGAIPVIAVAGHDTGSAVAAVPAQNEKFAYLSSGTWSLMGIEVKDAIINKESFEQNFTNEGGVEGTTRFLKNICGMWLLERCRKEWEATNNYSYTELIDAALAVPAFRSVINPDAPCFANPSSMIQAIGHYCKKPTNLYHRVMAKSLVVFSIVLPCATNKYSAICNKWPRSPSKSCTLSVEAHETIC